MVSAVVVVVGFVSFLMPSASAQRRRLPNFGMFLFLGESFIFVFFFCENILIFGICNTPTPPQTRCIVWLVTAGLLICCCCCYFNVRKIFMYGEGTPFCEAPRPRQLYLELKRKTQIKYFCFLFFLLVFFWFLCVCLLVCFGLIKLSAIFSYFLFPWGFVHLRLHFVF